METNKAFIDETPEFAESIINTIREPLIILDHDLRVVTASRSFYDVFKADPEATVGQLIYDLGNQQWNIPKLRELLETILPGKATFDDYEVENEFAGIGRRIMLLNVRQIERAWRKERIILVAMEDITERRKKEARLEQVQKMEAIGTLAGGIAHDFNNILTAILGYTELAVSKLPQDSDIRSDLQEVVKASLRATNLVKQILTFSHHSGKQLFPISICPIIKEVSKQLRVSLPATIEINQNIRASGKVLADITEIHRIMMNLCTNASHAMAENGGELSISLIQVNLPNDDAVPKDLPPGPYLKLTVSDTGCGMTPDALSRIFEPYYTTKETDKGTGLGLGVVHGIVESHGGFITVESTPGKGSCFHVYLPEIMYLEKNIETILAVAPDATGIERILFVDDELTIVQMGEQMLESLGYEVTGTTSGAEALELFKANPAQFDLVITDMTMPHMTGYQLAGNLIEIRSDIPIILCSGFSEKMTEEATQKIGIRLFIMKPMSRQVLSTSIRNVLDSN